LSKIYYQATTFTNYRLIVFFIIYPEDYRKYFFFVYSDTVFLLILIFVTVFPSFPSFPEGIKRGERRTTSGKSL